MNMLLLKQRRKEEHPHAQEIEDCKKLLDDVTMSADLSNNLML
jgi:hypothetical protein